MDIRRSTLATLLLVLAAARPGLTAADANPFRLKEGARGKGCLGCHEDFAAVLKRPSVHTPVKNGNCADCHDPHAADHGMLLGDEPNKICARCHVGISTVQGRSVHQPVAEGACGKCHESHASDHPNTLRQSGADLCLGCHKDMAETLSKVTFRHPPVAKSCLSCHTPHASPQNQHLLRRAVPALCLECHKPTDPGFGAAHQGYPVGKADCGSCHDPHGSSSRGMMWAEVHAPVRNKACGQCHQAPGAGEGFAVKETGSELCATCHENLVDRVLAQSRPHLPVLDQKGCLNCHNPHAGRDKPLLDASPIALCGRCHEDTMARQAASETKHEPVASGKCGSCHDPHGSGNPLLLTQADTNELCGTCHDWKEHSNHPLGAEVADPRNRNLSLDCLACHRSHGTPYKHFAHFDTKMDLCVQCHQQMMR